MSLKSIFTLKKFQYFYFHGKTHSAVFNLHTSHQHQQKHWPMSNFIPQLLYSFQQLSCIDPFLREIRPYNPSVSIPIKDNWDGLFIFSNVNASPLGEPYWLRSLHISTGIGQIPHFYSRSHSALWIDDESKSHFLLYHVVWQLFGWYPWGSHQLLFHRHWLCCWWSHSWNCVAWMSRFKKDFNQARKSYPVKGDAQVSTLSWHLDKVFSKSESGVE